MKLPLAFHPEVRDEAYVWYEVQREGLGEEFLASVRNALDGIGDAPELGPAVYRNVRVRLVHRFPYGVYYRVEADRIRVIAIQHGRRHPRRWKSRL